MTFAAAFSEREPSRIAWWGLSLLVVLAVHAGLALLLLSRQIVLTPAPALPAVLIELAPLPAAAPSPQQPAQEALPPAITEPPPAEPAALAQPEPEPRLKPEPEVMQPPSPAPTPVVTMPAPKPEPQPKPKSKPKAQPKPQPIDRPPPQPVTAPAPPAPAPAAAPTAPVLSPAAAAAARANWQGQLLAWLSRHKRYPREAQEQRQQGTAHLHFAVDRYGRVLSYNLARSSGFAALDEEIVALIQRAQPLPPPPPELPGMRFDLVVPVSFSLNRN